ncbi:MAG: UDP-3-O-(3-hydroxymyristoyl)glucosamine N-acyltransferase [Syntrophales bacterium]|nr:UDP-3-O-(3-hydroxymyristoyl)glucosamine N-acyltransferase [Syntrophales bacterium]
MEFTLREIATYLMGDLVGEEEAIIRAVRGIDEAGEGDITFVANPRYRKKALTTKATAIVVSRDTLIPNRNLVVVDDPYTAFGLLLRLFHPQEKLSPYTSEKAWIAKNACVSPEATVFPFCFIGERTRVEKGVVLYPGVFLDHDVVVGENTIIYPNVTIYRNSIIGKRVIIHAGAVIGSDGFGFAKPGQENIKIPQTGIVQIDDDVEIGANTTIDRGTIGKTWIKRGVKIDNLVQVAHNVVIGENSVIAGQVGISGSTKIGRGVVIGGQAGIVGHISIGDGTMIAARCGVHKDVKPRNIIAGAPHQPYREWLRTASSLPKLPGLLKTVNTLSQKIEELEKKLEEKGK